MVSLFPVLLATPARPQGVTATAKPTASPSTADAAAMKRRIDELERRVVDLEKQKADQLQLDKDDEAAAKKLEQRLAAVETAQRDAATRDKSANTPATSQTSSAHIVVAPFVVVDANGKRLITVDRSEDNQRARLTVGEPKGPAAVLAASSDTAYVQLVDTTDAVPIAIEAAPKHTGMIVRGKLGKVYLGENNGILSVMVSNKTGHGVAELRGMESQSGLLTISNAAGNALVMAGETTKGVGVVKTGPNGNGAAALLGNAGMAASEIQGKK